MKINIFLFIILAVFIGSLFVQCPVQGSGGGSGDRVEGETSESSINYQTVTVPEIINFPIGYTDVSEPIHTIPLISSFKMGKYEVTYAQWYTVRKWAESNGYTFANQGNEGTSSITGANPTIRRNEPVVYINWRDCIVWCNATSQYEGLMPVYYTDAGLTTPLKISTDTGSINTTAGSEDNPYINWFASGYRLPTEAEWEVAARYVTTLPWSRGDVPSGWIDNSPTDGNWRIEVGGDWIEDDVGDDYSEVNAVAWWYSNGGSATHNVGKKNANNLSIYDMSGNVEEWCWDWYGIYTTLSPYTDPDTKGGPYDSLNPYRIVRGGEWLYYADILQSSSRNNRSEPWIVTGYLGFRVCRIL